MLAVDSRETTRTTRQGGSRAIPGLWAICAVLVLSVAGVAALDIFAQRATAIADERRGLEQLGRVLAEDMSRYATLVDVELREVQARVAELPIDSAAQFHAQLSDRATFDFLRARVRELPPESAITLVDADGEIVNLSRVWPTPHINVRDRDYFRYLSTHDDATPYIVEVRRGRVTNTPLIFIMRRIDGPSGAFLGVVAGALDVGDLTARYQHILSREGESITLLTSDGHVLARYPGLTTAIGQRMPDGSPWYDAIRAGGGSYLSPGYLEHRPVIVSATPVPGYGLVVDMVVVTDVALAAWRKQAITVGLAALASAVGIIVLFAVIGRQFRGLQRATDALRASERRLRDFAQTGSEWFWEQDAALRFTWISTESPVLQPGDASYIGQTRWERVGVNPADPPWAQHQQDLVARRPFREFVYRQVGRDGKLHHLSVSGTPVFDAAGRFQGYRGTGRDITAMVDAAEELRRARDQAETASRVKSEFLASMTHELRTPLNAIIGFSELIRDQPFGPMDARYVEYAKEIHIGGHHLLAVINDVLDMSKIEAGRYELNDEQVDLGELVRACCMTLSQRAEEGQLRMERDVSLDGSLVRADGRAVRQVLLNLLSNALKFTPAGGQVSLRATMRGDGALTLSVTDSGIGIESAALALLFEPFQQADSSITRRFGGTGLGLSISRKLMMLHDGALELHSVAGQGTTVRMIFPPVRVVTAPNAGAVP